MLASYVGRAAPLTHNYSNHVQGYLQIFISKICFNGKEKHRDDTCRDMSKMVYKNPLKAVWRSQPRAVNYSVNRLLKKKGTQLWDVWKLTIRCNYIWIFISTET